MKYWINNIAGSDKLIIWDGKKLYKANPKDHVLRDFEELLKKGVIPEGIFSIDQSFIKEIEMDENKKYICVYFGSDSEEHFRVTDKKTKKEIYNELSNINFASTSVNELSFYQKAKKQIIAFIVLTVLFSIGFLFSYLIEIDGLPDGRYPAILLLLGGIGITKLILFYSIIIIILGIKLFTVVKTTRIIHKIKITGYNKR